MTEEQLREVVRFLEETPGSVQLLAAGLANDELRWKPSSDEFSVLEQVCHLRDLEREGYATRIRLLLTEDQPTLADIDGGSLAKERNYNSQNFQAGLHEFALAREENVRVLKAVSPEQFSRTGVLDGVGAITLGKLLVLMKEHDQSHRDELRDLRTRMPSSLQHASQYHPRSAVG